MTYAEERVAAEMGRVMLALYRAGMQVRLWPDAMHGRASARIVAGPSAKRRRATPQSATGVGDSPLQAIYAAVERLNERSGAIVVPLD
jgi:antitoxin (DNA-binding transcriptional repressor) of toxin-antitoxin stability system